jgi:hypothetical protein
MGIQVLYPSGEDANDIDISLNLDLESVHPLHQPRTQSI